MAKNNWTREETIVAFNVYCKVPFNRSSKNHPIIIEHANIIGRSPSALNMKVGNFGRLDPALKEKGIVGLGNGSKLDKEIWDEFHGNWSKLAFESELLISKLSAHRIEEHSKHDFAKERLGLDKIREVKNRVNQSFFRTAIMSAYSFKCCITGISIPELLIASHIIPWSVNKKERLNPKNGLCLNALHDKAFDLGLISVSNNYQLLISNSIKFERKENFSNNFLLKYENTKIYLPDKFQPDLTFLEYHRDVIFRKT